MSLSLVEALQQADVNFEVGQSYRCEVQGKVVEVRVLDELLASSATTSSPSASTPTKSAAAARVTNERTLQKPCSGTPASVRARKAPRRSSSA